MLRVGVCVDAVLEQGDGSGLAVHVLLRVLRHAPAMVRLWLGSAQRTHAAAIERCRALVRCRTIWSDLSGDRFVARHATPRIIAEELEALAGAAAPDGVELRIARTSREITVRVEVQDATLERACDSGGDRVNA
jgi:hypothetical protein